MAPKRGEVTELSKGSLNDGAVELFKTRELHDFTITCERDTYNPHAFVLVTQSTFFRSAILGGFDERIAKLMRLTPMDDEHPYPEYDDPEALAKMIYFLYHQEYEFGDVSGCTTTTDLYKRPPGMSTLRTQNLNMLAHAKMFAIAVKYDVSSLRRYAFKHFKLALASCSGNPGFGDVIVEVFTSTPDDAQELRGLVRATLSKPNMLNNPYIRAAIESVEGLAYDLLEKAKGK